MWLLPACLTCPGTRSQFVSAKSASSLISEQQFLAAACQRNVKKASLIVKNTVWLLKSATDCQKNCLIVSCWDASSDVQIIRTSEAPNRKTFFSFSQSHTNKVIRIASSSQHHHWLSRDIKTRANHIWQPVKSGASQKRTLPPLTSLPLRPISAFCVTSIGIP